MITAKKVWQLLNPREHRAALAQLGLMLIGMVLETLGIGLVIPALTLMTQSDLAVKYPLLAPWLNRLGHPSQERLIIVGMLILVGVYAIKALFLAFLAWRQAHFVSTLQANLSQRLFEGYMYQPYAFHLQRNSAQLIRNTTVQVSDIIQVIQQGLILITEILVLFGISMLLLTIEPLGIILIVCTLGLAAWGFHHFTRRHLMRWGAARQQYEGLRIQHLQQGLGGIKDVKLLGRESDFLSQYRIQNVGSASVNQRQATLIALPRLLLEFLAVVGLAALIMVMISQGRRLEILLPMLGLFAAAAFRIMPSVNRMLNAFQNMRFYLPVIDSMHTEFQFLNTTKPQQRGRPMPFRNELRLHEVSFQHTSAEVHTISGISLSIARGASVGIIGESGAGKSTLVDIILGLLTPVSGSITIDGIDVQTNLRGWQDLIGYVPQSIYLTDDTLRRNVAFGLPFNQIEDDAIWRAIRAAQLEQFVKELPRGLETLVGERGIRLSGGQRQRIGIARALYHDPAVLVLDEATSSLDTTTERDVMAAVRDLQRGKTIITVAHRLSTVEHCDYLYRLEAGKIIASGRPVVMLDGVPG